MTTINGNKCRCNRCGNVAEMNIDNDTEVVLCPYCTGAATAEALGKTVARLKRICFAVEGLSDLHDPDPVDVLGAVREWVTSHYFHDKEIDWLNPPADIAKILGE
jgi:hypothetical protein